MVVQLSRQLLPCTALLIGLVPVTSGCSGALSRAYPPAYNAAAGRTAIQTYDTNGDGLINSDELSQAPALLASLGQIDTDGDGSLSAQEIDARVKSWQDTRIAEMPVRCEVTLDGVPLADAEIAFDPEPFLGPKVRPASGITTETGIGGISLAKEYLADPKYAGVACGWYRIRVTSNSLAIPSRYNTETQLGCEVAMDASWVNHGAVQLDLKSK